MRQYNEKNNEDLVVLGVYRLSNLVEIPKFATEGSAAFDLRLFLDGTAVEGFDDKNLPVYTAPILEEGEDTLLVKPGCRYKLPTGLIFDIPENFWLSVNMRGGTALKKGLSLCNDTGIVDWDYTKETFVCVVNTSNSTVKLQNGERIAQAKLERMVNTFIVEAGSAPTQKTQRQDGFNSTGLK